MAPAPHARGAEADERSAAGPRVHEALNQRMTLMMGAAAEGRMHQLMGARDVGCATSGAAGSIMGGAGMMGAGSDRWSAMMGSAGYSWMMGGSWQHMTRQDWQQLRRDWLGTSRATNHRGGPGTLAVIAAALAIALLAALGLILRGRSSRQPPSAASPS